LNTFEHYWGK